MKKQVVYTSPVNGAKLVVDNATDPRNIQMASGIKIDDLDTVVATAPTVQVGGKEVPVETYLAMQAQGKGRGKRRPQRVA